MINISRAKKDITYFAEKVLHIHLLKNQRDLITKRLEATSMRKIRLEKTENGFYEVFGQNFMQVDRYGNATPESEFCKLKNGDQIEIKKV
jgi:hypothetical protein